MKKTIILLSTLLLSPIVLANSLVFSCSMNDGKKLSVTKNGNFFTYSFGRQGRPELVFTNRKNETEIEQSMDGYSGERQVAISLTNNGYDYIITSNLNTEPTKNAGITVFDGRKYTTYLCKPSSIVNNIRM